MKSIIRNIIILAVVVILGIVGYKLFFAKKAAAPAGGLKTTSGVGTGTSAAPNIATTGAGSPGSVSEDDFVSILLSVKSISVDDSIFKDRGFALLQDFNRPLPPDTNPGRVNPFAPIGSDGVASAAGVTTSNPSSITSTGATFNGTLMASDPSATRWFEYGTTSAFGSITTPVPQANPGAFADVVTKLLPNTTYYVRADALVGGATILGNTLVWKTAQSVR